MYFIKHYTIGTQSEEAPKGSSSNPYTQEEFFNLLEEGKWNGGYVEGLGYCEKEFVVNGHSSYFHFSFDDSWWNSEFPWSSWSNWEDGDNGNDGNSGNPSNNGGNENKPEGGTTHGGHKGNSGNGLSGRTVTLLKAASDFSSSVKSLLQKLVNERKIKETNDIAIIARWDEENNVMILGPNAQANNVLHELTHYFQTESTHSNKEWQAYMLDDVYDMLDAYGAQHGEGMNSGTYAEYRDLLIDNSGILPDGTPYVTYKVIEYFYGLDTEKMVRNFMVYWEQKGRYSYVDWYDALYNWNWERILRGMGFIII